MDVMRLKHINNSALCPGNLPTSRPHVVDRFSTTSTINWLPNVTNQLLNGGNGLTAEVGTIAAIAPQSLLFPITHRMAGMFLVY